MQVFETLLVLADAAAMNTKAPNKLSKLESQPRTHKGATREANTTAIQKFRPAKHRLEHDVRNINHLSYNRYSGNA